MRALIIGLTLAVLLAGLALAASLTIKNAAFEQEYGVRLNGGDMVTIAEGQTIGAVVKVIDKASAKLFSGVKAGDGVQVTMVSIRDHKLKLMHVPSGISVTVDWSEAIGK